MNVNTQNEDDLLEKAKFNSGDFLNSVPDAMERFVPELAAEIEARIKADQESDHPSPRQVHQYFHYTRTACPAGQRH